MKIDSNNRTSSTVVAIQSGIVGGVIASMAMAMYAMVVTGVVQSVGFFTPLYHIASVVTSPAAMMASMDAAMAGNAFYFSAGTAIVGAAIHMMTGAMAGVAFVLLARMTAIKGLWAVIAGAMFGLVVMLVNGLCLLPITSRLFDRGEAITNMADIVGWGHFSVQHLIYGMMLGLVYTLFAFKKSA